MKKSYVLIDYENVQPASLAALEGEPFHVLVFVGASQAKVTFELVSVLQRMGERAEYIKATGSGRNAVDFHIAYYMGQIAAREADAAFYLVSKDTGFDPLLQHLRDRKITAQRVKSVADLPLAKAATSRAGAERASSAKAAASKPAPDPASLVIAKLVHGRAARPRTVKTLTSAIHSLFQRKLPEAEVAAIIAELARRGIIVVNQSRISYAPPGAH